MGSWALGVLGLATGWLPAEQAVGVVGGHEHDRDPVELHRPTRIGHRWWRRGFGQVDRDGRNRGGFGERVGEEPGQFQPDQIAAVTAAVTATVGGGRDWHGWLEPSGWEGHVQRLMRPVGVVVVPERVNRGLRRGQIREHAGAVEQLAAQRLVEPFDLPRRGRRGRLGKPMHDAVLPADPVEEHLAAVAEPVGELLAVVGK